MTEEDCRRIGNTLRAAWMAEVKRAAPAAVEGPSQDKALMVLQSEGERLSSEWLADCKEDLRGRSVAPRELDCLTGQRTLDQLRKCAEP
jgi:hypothetical protein